MEKLTVNQLMLLLDLYRGTLTQEKIGTRKKDLIVLSDLGFINEDGVTKNGNAFIKYITVIPKKFDYQITENIDPESKEALKYVMDCLSGFQASLKKAGF